MTNIIAFLYSKNIFLKLHLIPTFRTPVPMSLLSLSNSIPTYFFKSESLIPNIHATIGFIWNNSSPEEKYKVKRLMIMVAKVYMALAQGR
jgi:hypothetical protein